MYITLKYLMALNLIIQYLSEINVRFNTHENIYNFSSFEVFNGKQINNLK